MKIRDLLVGLSPEFKSGDLDAEVVDITFDSRRAAPGSVFFALPGARTDGNRFIRQAASKRAVAVISELKPPPAPILLGQDPAGGGVAWVQVEDVFVAMARASATFFDDPSAAMKVFGITGTNGKTTVAAFLESIVSRGGGVPGVIGTVGHRLRHRVIAKAANTTPFSLELTRLLSQMRSQGATHVAMEVSSHALATKRVEEVHFDAGIMTNLHSDHLDFHKSREAYFAAKARLFELLEKADSSKTDKLAVLNLDDESCLRLRRRALDLRFVTFGTTPEADYWTEGPVFGLKGCTFRLRHGERSWVAKIRLLGEHNVANAAAAAAVAMATGSDPVAVLEGLTAVDSIPGRLEPVREGQGFTVLVDFAHTSRALAAVLGSLGKLPHRRIITVFGCGGERDRSKRGPMGAAACAGSDLAIATSDNPRGEDPLEILKEVEGGMRGAGRENHRIIPDRASAIREAVGLAQEGDIVLIAGKGHETRQVLKDRVVDFDDREQVRAALKDSGKC